MTVSILIGDVHARLDELPDDFFDTVVTSPPYWGLRSYLDADHPDKHLEIGLEPTLGQHLEVIVDVMEKVRRVLKPSGVVFLNYGDCYATSPNGRSAADTKAAGNDDRTFRDKPFSTVGPVYNPDASTGGHRGGTKNTNNPSGRVQAGGYLKPKDLCLIPQRLAVALQERGWWVRSLMPWVKRNGMPESISDRPASSVEYIIMLTKSERYAYDAEVVRRPASPSTNARVNESFENATCMEVLNDRNFRNSDLFFDSLEPPFGLISGPDGLPIAIDVCPQGFKEAHFATFPEALVRPLLRAGNPNMGPVLDPFGGAGTVGLVADQLGMSATLIELNEESAAISRRRIEGDAGMFSAVTVEAA